MNSVGTLESTVSQAAPAPHRRSWWWGAAVGGLLLGSLDLAGQVHMPYPWAHLFNSPALWGAAAWGFGRWTRAIVPSIVGATIVMIIGVETYYLADVLVRGADTSNPTSPTAAAWLAAGLLAGPVFGTAGAWATRQISSWRSTLGRAALPALFAAEAVFQLARRLTEPADARPDDLGGLAVLLLVTATALSAVLVRRLPRRAAARIVAVATGAALMSGCLVFVAI